MSKDYSHVPDWCRPGAEVAEIGGRDNLGVRRRTVLRISKTRVVTDGPNGTEIVFKIRPDGEIRRQGAGSAWDPLWTLVPLTDPEVKRRSVENRRRDLAAEVERLALKWRRDGDVAAARRIAQCLKDAGVIADYELPETDS